MIELTHCSLCHNLWLRSLIKLLSRFSLFQSQIVILEILEILIFYVCINIPGPLFSWIQPSVD